MGRVERDKGGRAGYRREYEEGELTLKTYETTTWKYTASPLPMCVCTHVHVPRAGVHTHAFNGVSL